MVETAFIVSLSSSLAVWIVLIAETLNFLCPWRTGGPWILVTGAAVRARWGRPLNGEHQ